MQITKDQLDHLADLSSLQLTEEEKERLLPHLENILAFVGKLQECDVDQINPLAHPQDDVVLHTNEGVGAFAAPESILANVQHEIRNGAIGVQPATRE